MPLADTTLAVSLKARCATWRPLLPVEDTGGNVFTALDAWGQLAPDKLIYAKGEFWLDKFTPLGKDGTNLLSNMRAPFRTAVVVDVFNIGGIAKNMVTSQQARQTPAMFDTTAATTCSCVRLRHTCLARSLAMDIDKSKL